MNQISIGSDNGLSPIRRRAIIWTCAVLLAIEPFGTNFSDILAKIQTSSFTKMHLKKSSAKRRPLCPRGEELTGWSEIIIIFMLKEYAHSHHDEEDALTTVSRATMATILEKGIFKSVFFHGLFCIWTGILTMFVCKGSIKKYVSIGLNNGLVLNRRQPVIWTNDRLVYWRIWSKTRECSKTCVSYNTMVQGRNIVGDLETSRVVLWI